MNKLRKEFEDFADRTGLNLEVYKNGEYKTKFSEQEHESLKKFLEYRKFELEDFSN